MPIFVSKVDLFCPFKSHLSVEVVIVGFVVESTGLTGLASILGVGELSEDEVGKRSHAHSTVRRY